MGVMIKSWSCEAYVLEKSESQFDILGTIQIGYSFTNIKLNCKWYNSRFASISFQCAPLMS